MDIGLSYKDLISLYSQYKEDEYGFWYVVSHGYHQGTFGEVLKAAMSQVSNSIPSIYKVNAKG